MDTAWARRSGALGRGVAGGDWFVVSGASSAGASGLGELGMEVDREQPAGEVLPHYRRRQEAIASDQGRWQQMVDALARSCASSWKGVSHELAEVFPMAPA